MTEEQVKASLIDQLRAKGMTSAFYLDKVDEYMTYWRTMSLLKEDIDRRGVRIVQRSGNGFEKEMFNESVREMPKLTAAMLNILKTLGLQEPVEKEVTDGSDYL